MPQTLPDAPHLTLDDCIEILGQSTRSGMEIDMPEGSRYVQISSTLAYLMAECLSEYRGSLGNYAVITTDVLKRG
jgi:hypothetical protein